ncbi:MAG TPA: respiratory nitrate reductase subunit gamma [Terriglobales bacterium]|nr:respiratory nitrate reductase subunit gamma [Terriglobales bacterium]
MTKDILFSRCPYAAIALLAVGLGVRSMQLRNQPWLGTLKIGIWNELRSRRPLQVCLFLLVIGHLSELLFPRQVIAWNNSPLRLYLLEGLLFVSGVSVLVGCLSIIGRHLEHSVGSVVTQKADAMFLALLFVGVFSGLFLAAAYRWASSWAVVTLTPYVLSLIHAAPDTAYVTEMPFLIRLHVFCAFGCMAVFPLTSIAPVFIITLHRSAGVVFRSIAGIVRKSVNRTENQLRLRNLTLWLWPEEED